MTLSRVFALPTRRSAMASSATSCPTGFPSRASPNMPSSRRCSRSISPGLRQTRGEFAAAGRRRRVSRLRWPAFRHHDRGLDGAHGTRFCSCSLCGTLWNYIRAKCTLCGSTKEISFQAVEAGPETVKAETCSSCQGYVKIVYQDKVPAADPIADDVATLGLDLLVRELDFRRGGVNPFLIGY